MYIRFVSVGHFFLNFELLPRNRQKRRRKRRNKRTGIQTVYLYAFIRYLFVHIPFVSIHRFFLVSFPFGVQSKFMCAWLSDFISKVLLRLMCEKFLFIPHFHEFRRKCFSSLHEKGKTRASTAHAIYTGEK